MNGQQNIVGLGGLALIGANYWTGQRTQIDDGLFNSSATSAQQATAHTALKNVVLELLFVGVATLIAGMSAAAGTAMVAVIVALAILWAIKHYSKGS